MLFPRYRLADYQTEWAPQAKHMMCASVVNPRSLQEVLQLASGQQLQQWHDLSLSYASGHGDLVLREAISERYPGLSADNVLTFAGAQEAMFCAFHALLSAGDEVLGISPQFEPLRLLPVSIGVRLNEFELSPLATGWQLDTEQFVAQITSATKMVVINFPHNPTGAQIGRAALDSIIENCRQRQSWLFSDEVFQGLEYHESECLPAVACVYEKGISLGVISKAYGLGGVRVGWLVSQDMALLQRALQIKRFLSISNSRTDELLATIALQHGEGLLQQNRQQVRQNLALLQQRLPQLATTLCWYAPAAGCVAFPQLLHTESAESVAEALLRQQGVMIIPGNCFARQGFASHVRIGFGLADFNDSLQGFTAFFGQS